MTHPDSYDGMMTAHYSFTIILIDMLSYCVVLYRFHKNTITKLPYKYVTMQKFTLH